MNMVQSRVSRSYEPLLSDPRARYQPWIQSSSSLPRYSYYCPSPQQYLTLFLFEQVGDMHRAAAALIHTRAQMGRSTTVGDVEYFLGRMESYSRAAALYNAQREGTLAYERASVLRQSPGPPRRRHRPAKVSAEPSKVQSPSVHAHMVSLDGPERPARAGLSQGPFTSIKAAHDNSVQAVQAYICVGECSRPLSPCCCATAENDERIAQVSGPRKESSTSSGPHGDPG